MNELNVLKEVELPFVIDLNEVSPDNFISYYTTNKEEIENCLQEKGAIKFRGVSINSVTSFQYIIDSISSKFLSYIDGNSPRTKLSSHVYTSTEYEKTQRITMHNELSYSAKWPNKLFFSCLQPAETGGETLLADCRTILKRMNKSIVSQIMKNGIVYFRNLHSGRGLGPSWQDTFETRDKDQLEAYCKAYSIPFEWIENNMLRLKQPSKGIIEHRHTKEKVWFNQIDQFHPCHLGEEMYETMKLLYSTPENFPMHVRLGNGSDISESFVQDILQTIDEVTVAPPWQKNELLILDNEVVAHGRNSFTGDRKVLVAMSE